MSPTLSKRESELGIRTIYCDVIGYEASNTLNIPYNSIRKCCKGNMKQTHSFIFRYKVGDK